MGFLDLIFHRGQQDSRSVAEPGRAAEAAKNRGNEHLATGELNLAAECYEEAIRLHPGYAEAHVNLGHVRREQKRYAESEQLLLRAAALKPSLWQAHFQLGITAEAQGQLDEAIACYRHILEMRPSYLETQATPEVHWRLANLYAEQDRHADALQLMDELIAVVPDSIEAQCNRGTALNKLGRNEEALAQYRRVIAMNPDMATPIHFLGVVYEDMGQRKEALDCYERALALDPDHPDIRVTHALLLLLLGDYERGWAAHEAMLPRLCGKDNSAETDAQFFRRTFTPEKYWNGEPLNGGALLIWTEQGLGDTLMMLRYLPMIKDRGVGRIVVHCEKALVRLVDRLPAVDEVVLKPSPVDGLRFDRHCSTMSLPFLFQTRLDTIPNRVPYISVPDHATQRWKDRLALHSGLKVGLAWGGNKLLAKDRQRSIPLVKFAPLLGIAGVTWVSLQKGEPASQLKGVDWPIIDWMGECEDMQDTGALMEALDLVICVDTSVAHLAGALGRPTWLLNRFGSEWRWLLEREDPPWYPSLRIFRQPSPDDWDSVVSGAAAELSTLAKRG